MKVAAVLMFLVLLVGCGPEHLPPPSTPAPALATPAAAIPADLDVALRIDLRSMRDALGPELVARIERRTPGRAGAAGGDARLMEAAFKRADTVWIALRPERRVGLMDNVIVLQGHFGGLDPCSFETRPRWGPAVDLGGVWRLYSRPTPATRAAPARIYARSDGLLVFVSTAEIDSARRAIEERAGDEHLEPEAKGAISIAARLPALAGLMAERSPAAARLLRRGKRLQADADLGARGLDAELGVEFDTPGDARSAAAAAGLLAKGVAREGGAVGGVARALHIEAAGSSLVVRVRLTRDELGELTACAGSPGRCRIRAEAE